MDSKFVIPGTSIRFGLDPILSILPAAGDIVTLLISGMLVFQMQKHGVSRKVVIKMLFNVLIDALIGAIPILGVIFDVYYKANDRNVKLLKEHYQEGKHAGSGTGLILLFLFAVLLLMSAIIYLFYLLIQYLWEL